MTHAHDNRILTINSGSSGLRIAPFGHEPARGLVKTFLAARFGGAERHRCRLAKVADLENKR